MAARDVEEAKRGDATEGESGGAMSGRAGGAEGAVPRTIALDDESADDALAAMGTLPRVRSISVIAAPTRVEGKAPVKSQKANVAVTLKPFSPTPRRSMVTMSDMSGTGGARGGVSPARNKRAPE